MTIDDDSSIYVGGLPYDSTEESLRKIFDIYGAVVAVKIINDRTVGGKCYGFVTFTNPRSAMHAIKEMDGRTIDGRVVRVNEVKTRGGRSSFGREGFHRISERGIGSDQGRDREKDHDRVRDLDRDNYRGRSRDRDQEREIRYDQLYDNDRTRDRPVNRDGFHDHNRDLEDFERQRERVRDYDWERDRDGDKEMQMTPDHRKSRERDNDQATKILDRSYDRGKRERSSESSGGDQGEIAKQVQISNQKLHELQKEISQMEELAEEKKQIVLKLQEKSQKLEDSLTAASRFTSFRQSQLSKLNKCYLQIRDCNQRLKSYESELQSLVDSTAVEVGYGDGVGTRDGILTNGGA